MSIYLGTFGKVELQRRFDGTALSGVVNPDDVNVTRKRLSFDFKIGELITGDQVEIATTKTGGLDFFSSYTGKRIKKFIHVDTLGGIRFYSTFADAINGTVGSADTLAAPSGDTDITIEVRNAERRIIAQTNSYELNTQRETVDTTALSEEFRNQVSTLLSGSGSMSCFWEYTGDTVNELPHYLLQLVLRTKVGGSFNARFYLKTGNHNPSGGVDTANDELWYEFEGILTACALQFTPDSAVQFSADFVTTGEIKLRASFKSTDALVQEDSDDLLLEQDATAKLLLESSD